MVMAAQCEYLMPLNCVLKNYIMYIYHNKKGQIKINSQVKVNWYPESLINKYYKEDYNSCNSVNYLLLS